MQYRNLGSSDIRVSEICLGSMTWGTQNSEAEGHAQIDCALDHGVNFIDTAASELELGTEVLEDILSVYRRYPIPF